MTADLPQRRNPRRFVGESYRDCVDRLAGELSATERDRDALQAQLRLEVAHCGEFQARVEVLTAALTGLVEMQFPTDGVIHRSSFEHVRREALWDNARAALAAGEIESAPLSLNESGEVPLSYFSKPGETESEAP